jgi:hypothetical protein
MFVRSPATYAIWCWSFAICCLLNKCNAYSKVLQLALRILYIMSTEYIIAIYTRAVWKFRRLTLLLRVGTLWRCGDGLFFEVPPFTSDALLTTLHPLLVNGVTVVLKEPFLGWRSNFSGASALRNWKVVMDELTEISGTPLEHPPHSPDLAQCDCWAFPTMERELQGQNRLFHYPPEACGKRSAAHFREVSGSL